MFIAIDNNDPRPVYLQIASSIKEQIQKGMLEPGDELPSVRDLARGLDINLHTARHAYQLLREQGVVLIRLGNRARIAPLRATPADRVEIERKVAPRLRELVTDAFHLGITSKQFRQLVDEAIAQNERKVKS
jgi:GntR family transcriptional regulator